MRTRTVETVLYQYGELSEPAKKKAREWLRELEAEDFDHSYVYEDFETIAGILGIELKTRSRQTIGGKTAREVCIWYRGFSSQGDGACFEGVYRYAKQSSQKIREHAPLDLELHRIADELFEAQRQWQYGIIATVTHTGHYSHSRSVTIDVEDGVRDREIGEAREVVSEALRDLMDWLYAQLETEYEYRLADAQIEDAILSNEYEFTEDGGRA